MTARDLHLLFRCVLRDDGHAGLDLDHPMLFEDLDAFAPQGLADQSGGFLVVFGQDREHLDHRDPAAEPAMGLRHLKADRAAANDDQMVRPLAVLKDAFVSQIIDLIQSRNRRHHGGGAGGDDEASGRDLPITDADPVRSGEDRRALDDVDAEAAKAFHRILRRDRGDDAGDMILHFGEIDHRFHRANAEGGALPLRLGRVTRGEQCFRRDAAIVQAVAAHFRPLDQNGLGVQLTGAGGHGQAARAGADHANVDMIRQSTVNVP